ncbi:MULTISPECIES: tryptophan halogenase family protein [Pseudomonas]|uniref:tryptophan halogenase family protein n=1 Tax=Pseudomonas TaxID=286 RepID=UPI00214750CE|nr:MULTISPECIES: tryptophan halogenase family protein [Pseudomonas]UUT23017.1 tryptophan 7-halogenase [Pseudomonas sp. T8]WJV26349.1 tryptophan 7-halogenase [Pseudomonas chlororaphis]
MLDLQHAKRVAIIGGGTAGWFAALMLRRIFSPKVEITLIESPDIGIIGVGEGGLLNLVSALEVNGISVDEFVRETGAAYKLGFVYEGWRGGGSQDSYYHLFGGQGIEELEWQAGGFFPLLSAMIASGEELHWCVPGYSAIARNVSQEEVRSLLMTGKSGLSASYHFDSHRVAAYLKKVALSRGVIHRSVRVDALTLNERGNVRAIQFKGGTLDVDFVVDASGFARLGIGKAYGAPWRSFSDYLPLDRAIPFHLHNPAKNPALLTRAISMKAGWMWQIPLIERVGCGYVFSSKHIDEAAAVAEVESYLGHGIEPMSTLRFEAGHFERVWINNVVALGLASGFVEPLEATSIGQMLEQLRNLERTLVNSHGVVSGHAIEAFNHANAQCWSGIRDFLRMHYDCPRNDTPFWRDVAEVPLSESYAELKQCFQRRTPRLSDIDAYVGNGWQGIFHTVNWMFVAAPLGVVPIAAARAELRSLPPESRLRVQAYLARKRNAWGGVCVH